MSERAVLAPTWIPERRTCVYGSGQTNRLASASRPPDLVGERAGSFRLTRLLARGGMGTVYLGEHLIIGSKVAVKVLHPHLAHDHSVVERFFAEARAVNLIGHPKIVKIFDMNRLSSGEWYLVMEYLEGTSTAELLGTPQPPDRVANILLDVLAALQAAHERGIVHRDVKPENVFLTKAANGSMSAKLLDFGIARFFAEPGSGATQLGVVLGTPAFMSPEQWQGGRVDARSDLYAVGALGRALLGDSPPFLSTRPEREGCALDPVLAMALASRPDDRYPTATAMAEALAAAIRPAPPSAPLPRRTQAPRYPGIVRERGSGRSWSVICADLSRAGLFVLGEGDLPKMRSLLDVTVELPGGRLEVRAEVVRHVSAETAGAWNMEPGYAVQFLEGGKTLSGRLQTLLQSGRRGVSPSEAETVDEPVERRLEALAALPPSDPYALLEVARDASMAEVRRRARLRREELAALGRHPLEASARARLDRLQERFDRAATLLSDPERRAEHDARQGNFLGVARCLAGGLGIEDLDGLRRQFEKAHPRQLARAQIHRITAALYLDRGDHPQAVREYEQALVLDPLDLGLHQVYWRLVRQQPAHAVG